MIPQTTYCARTRTLYGGFNHAFSVNVLQLILPFTGKDAHKTVRLARGQYEAELFEPGDEFFHRQSPAAVRI